VWSKTIAALREGEPVTGWFFPAGTEAEVPGVLRWSLSDGARLDLIGPVEGWPRELAGDPFTVHGYTREGEHFTLLNAWINGMSAMREPRRVTAVTLALGGMVLPEDRWQRAIYRTGNLDEWRADTGLRARQPDRRSRARVRIEWEPPDRDEVRLPGAVVAFTGDQEAMAGPMPTWSIAASQHMVVNLHKPATISEARRRYGEPLVSLTSFAADRPDALISEVVLDPMTNRRVEVWRTGRAFQPREWRSGDEAFVFQAWELRNFARSIRRWWTVFEDLRPALGLFADHLQEGLTYSRPRFLTLYTAAEGYCRGRFKRKDFRRLHDYAAVDDRVTGCTPDAMALIGATRDNFSHLTVPESFPLSWEEIEDAVLATTRRLNALMQACLMRELGFGTRAITRGINDHYRHWPIPLMNATCTPTELAVTLWGASESHSRSQGARLVRELARELFPRKAPGKGGQWHLTAEQQAAIRARIFSDADSGAPQAIDD
jgi:hypothetical protein